MSTKAQRNVVQHSAPAEQQWFRGAIDGDRQLAWKGRISRVGCVRETREAWPAVLSTEAIVTSDRQSGVRRRHGCSRACCRQDLG